MNSHLPQLPAAPDLVEQVYRRLLDAISDGSMPPGLRLTQEEVAEQLAVSRQPVLQALRQLKNEGLVQDAPGQHGHKGRGVLVSPLDSVLIAHIYQVRGALDALAAQLAAQRRVTIDPDLIRQGRLAAASTDIGAMMNADMAFHRAIYQASGNPLIEASSLLHWAHIRRAMGESLRHGSLRAAVWDEHAAIADAVAAGDIAGVTTLTTRHCEQASANLQRLLARNAPAAATPPPVNSVVP
jgi:DNA-binding GntR family transcriptional regulator